MRTAREKKPTRSPVMENSNRLNGERNTDTKNVSTLEMLGVRRQAERERALREEYGLMVIRNHHVQTEWGG